MQSRVCDGPFFFQDLEGVFGSFSFIDEEYRKKRSAWLSAAASLIHFLYTQQLLQHNNSEYEKKNHYFKEDLVEGCLKEGILVQKYREEKKKEEENGLKLMMIRTLWNDV